MKFEISRLRSKRRINCAVIPTGINFKLRYFDWNRPEIMSFRLERSLKLRHFDWSEAEWRNLVKNKEL